MRMGGKEKMFTIATGDCNTYTMVADDKMTAVSRFNKNSGLQADKSLFLCKDEGFVRDRLSGLFVALSIALDISFSYNYEDGAWVFVMTDSDGVTICAYAKPSEYEHDIAISISRQGSGESDDAWEEFYYLYSIGKDVEEEVLTAYRYVKSQYDKDDNIYMINTSDIASLPKEEIDALSNEEDEVDGEVTIDVIVAKSENEALKKYKEFKHIYGIPNDLTALEVGNAYEYMYNIFAEIAYELGETAEENVCYGNCPEFKIQYNDFEIRGGININSNLGDDLYLFVINSTVEINEQLDPIAEDVVEAVLNLLE